MSLLTKRGHDTMSAPSISMDYKLGRQAQENVVSCNRQPFLASPPLKRFRSELKQQHQHNNNQFNSSASSSSSSSSTVSPLQPTKPSHFPAPMSRSRNVANQYVDHVVAVRSRKRKKMSKTPKTTFTEDQVREMIAEAIQASSETLKLEYDSILNERLAEQFASFTRFNQDYVSRMFTQDDDCSYFS